MSIRDKNDIRVYNECPFQVNLVGQRRDYIFPPCEDGEPTMNFVNFDEIEYAHSRGKLFTIGLLIFDEAEQEKLYEALGIKDWQKKVWRNSEIEDAIMNPTLEKMQRIIDVKDMITLERIRGMMVRFVNEKRDVSQNVINVINTRFKELNSGNTTSKIELRASDVEKRVSADEVDALKKQLEETQKLMLQMQQQMMGQSKTVAVDKVENQTKSAAKRPGRKPTSKL